MGKNILFLVTGMTPQIITETVWALACDPKRADKWIPDEVHVMSTEHGLNQIRARLINEGNFQALVEEYDLPAIRFDESCLHSINNEQNEALTDLKTPEDNQLAGDAICAKVREFTELKDVSLHVSIAGGRKTMGFYAGYALSLYGRKQDRMSHVLVEDKYEQAVNFFYPSSDPTVFSLDRDRKAIGPSRDAKIWLADIPFVRLRNSLPDAGLIKSATFSEVVNTLNLLNQPIQVVLNKKQQTVRIGDVECKLPLREFAFYLWFATQLQMDTPYIAAPHKDIDIYKDTDKSTSLPMRLAKSYLAIYTPLKGGFMADEAVQNTLKNGMDRGFFNERRTNLHKRFRKAFGHDVTKKIEIVNLSRSDKAKDLSRAEKNKLIGCYQLLLNNDQLDVVD